MPGIVGIVTPRPDQARIERAVEVLSHFDGNVGRAYVGDRYGVGQVWRDDTRRDDDWAHGADDITVHLMGHALQDGPGGFKRWSARDILAQYTGGGNFPVDDLDGAFVIAICDPRKHAVIIYNDRLGTYPFYLYQHDDVVAFAPEVKCLFAMTGDTPVLSREGVINFLINGYCLAEVTLYERIRMIGPAAQLRIDTQTGEVRQSRYWNLVYEPDRRMRSRKTAEEALYDAVVRSHELMLCDSPQRHEILLSGGMDSRGILGALAAIDRLPARAFTWGESEDIPHSDASVAKALAAEFGVPFDFLSYDTGEFINHARQWSYVSELINDNIGWYAEGQPVLAKHYATGAAFTLTGDECWGVRGYAIDEHEARMYVLPPEPPPAMQASLTEASRRESADLYDDIIGRVLAPCENTDWIDRKDYLYVFARLRRFVLSLGYYKELAVEVRRPFLTRAVIDVIRRMPIEQRVNKNLFIGMLKHRMPRTMSVPEQTVDSLPDWPYAVRVQAQVRKFFLDHLSERRIEHGILGDLIDVSSFAALRDDFFAQEVTPQARVAPGAMTRLKRRLKPLGQRSRTADRITRALRKGNPRPPRTTFDFLSDVALLTLLESQLPALGGQR